METWVDGRDEQGELQYSFPHALERLEGWVQDRNSPITLRGVRGELRLFLLLALHGRGNSPMVLVTPTERDAQALADQIAIWSADGGWGAIHVPSSTVSPYQTLPSNRLIESARIRGLREMARRGSRSVLFYRLQHSTSSLLPNGR